MFLFLNACSSTTKTAGTNSDDVYFSPPKENPNTTDQPKKAYDKKFFSKTLQDSVSFPKDSNITGCLTLGVLQGGGSLIGFDIELPLSRHVGVQYGLGFFGTGGTLCYHFLPDACRSFAAINYWRQGFGDNHVQSLLGPAYVFRSKGVPAFTAQLGLGYITDRGPLFENVYKNYSPDVILMYSIGLCFFTKNTK